MQTLVLLFPVDRALAIQRQKILKVTREIGSSTAAASAFIIGGNIRIASIVLTPDFRHNSDGGDFSASVKSQDEEATLGDVLRSMLDDTAELDLPDFVANMKLMAKKDLDVLGLRAGESTPPANKKDAKEAAGAVIALDTGGSDRKEADPIKFFYLIASINIGVLGFTFAQIHSSDWEPTAPSKRLFRAKVDLAVRSPPLSLTLPLTDRPFLVCSHLNI